MANSQPRAHVKIANGSVSYITIYDKSGSFRPSVNKVYSVSGTQDDPPSATVFAWNGEIDIIKSSDKHLLIKLTSTHAAARLNGAGAPSAGTLTITLTNDGNPTQPTPAPVTYLDDGTSVAAHALADAPPTTSYNVCTQAHLKLTQGSISFMTLHHKEGKFDPTKITKIDVADSSKSIQWAGAVVPEKCNPSEILVKLLCIQGKPPKSDVKVGGGGTDSGQISITITGNPTPTTTDPTTPVTYVDDGT